MNTQTLKEKEEKLLAIIKSDPNALKTLVANSASPEKSIPDYAK